MSTLCLEHARAGNSAATEHLIATLRPRLVRMARYYAACSREDADDLLQEAWAGLLEALPGVDTSIGNPEAYLLRYARWRVLDAIRRQHARRHLLPGDDALDSHPTRETLDVALTAAALADFLTRLTLTQRAILACLLAGCTWRETGHLLGCTSANVAYHVKRIQAAYHAWAAEQ
ncbi:MAG: RNA polymerase sigma factor [bacterium ADurb.Bin429]|nr:MAG: RNA polymerase sigma factor [bacterium ADurb.Bin429]